LTTNLAKPNTPQTGESFCFFFQKEALFFFEKWNQKTFPF